MLRERRNQCIVISGESGSGKTESTNFLLHHLTALSQKGSHGSGVEQTILSAGPVLEVSLLCFVINFFDIFNYLVTLKIIFLLLSRLLVMRRLPIIITQVDLVNLYKLIIKKMGWYMGKYFMMIF